MSMIAPILILLPLWAHAAGISELQVSSNYDQFTLQVSGERFRLNGRLVNSGPLVEILDLFKNELLGDCHDLPNRDLTIKAVVGGKSIERRFYIARQLVGDGKNCVPVGGEGLLYLPLHRTWFENTRETISIKSRVELVNDKGETVLSLVKEKGRWRSKDPAKFLNWDFINRFLDSLSRYDVDSRMHVAAAQDKLSFTLNIDGKKHQIHKITPSQWAMRKPGVHWLISSNYWSPWLDLSKDQLMDRYNDQFATILDANLPAEARVEALRSFEGQWSPSISSMLALVMSYKNSPVDLSLEAIRQLRQKPSEESMRIFIKALDDHENRDILAALTRALRIRNPKGPELNNDADSEEIEKARQEWRAWWATFKKQNAD